MFGVKNPCNDLQYSERFHYTNYEYYNDYDQPSNFPNDVSKIFYHTRRKMPPQIVFYQHTNNTQNRYIKANPHSQEPVTMEMFFGAFLNAFDQNNFSDFPDGALEMNKNRYNIVYYPRSEEIKNSTHSAQQKQKKKSAKYSLDFARLILDILKSNIDTIMLKEGEDMEEHELEFYRYWLAHSELSYCELHHVSRSQEINNRNNEALNVFRIMIEQMLANISNTDSWAHLLLYVPNLSYMSYFFNPLISGVYSFLKIEESYSKSDSYSNEDFIKEVPKIAFINLDGFETPLNLQMIHASSFTSLLYITMFEEDDPAGKFSEEQTEANHAYSQLLARLISSVNEETLKNKQQRNSNQIYLPKILAFPLNSSYVQAKSGAKMMGSSEDILFLFETILYDELRLFSPNTIIISYSGRLNISPPHFTSIISNLSIISDHRIVLFPNMCTLFNEESPLLKFDSSSSEFSIHSDEGDLATMGSLLEAYNEFSLEQLDLNEYFHNLGMFLKISSGAYSLEKREVHGPHEKYQTGDRYHYIQSLAKIPEFSYVKRYASKGINGLALRTLLLKQRQKFLDQNSQLFCVYDQFLYQAIEIIRHNREALPHRLQYRLMRVKGQKMDSEEQLHMYLVQRKKCILLETIKREKVSKGYVVDPNSQKLKTYEFFLSSSKGSEQIYLDGFSQLIYDPSHKFVFCINYMPPGQVGELELQSLYGFLSPQTNQVELREIPNSRVRGHTVNVSYSYTFSKSGRYLYLYWPLQWNLLLEAESLLLNLRYEARPAHALSIVEIKDNGEANWMNFIPTMQTLECAPRSGSSAYCLADDTLYIFGGILCDERDFTVGTSGASVMKISTKDFEVIDIPKRVLGVQLRPKMNYVVEEREPGILCIRGGYGREFTNFYNIYSYTQYLFRLDTHETLFEKTSRQISTLTHPMRTSKPGQFDIVQAPSQSGQSQIIGEKTHVCSKHKFVISSKDGNPHKATAFVSTNYTVNCYKDPEVEISHSFGFRKSIKAVLAHTHCSPELFLENEHSEIVRIQLLFKVLPGVCPAKAKNLNIFPNEDSIISVCMPPNCTRLYALCKSPNYTGGKHVLYEGNLTRDHKKIIQKKQLVLTPYLILPQTGSRQMEEKTLHWTENGILLVGGISTGGIREDYLIEEKLNKPHITAFHLTAEQPGILDLPNGYVYQKPRHSDIEEEMNYLIYGLGENKEEEGWSIKIEKLSLFGEKREVLVSSLSVLAVIEQQNEEGEFEERIYEIAPEFDNPIFTNIQKCHSFLGVGTIRDKAQGMLILIRRAKVALPEGFGSKLEEICSFIAKQSEEDIVEKQMEILFNLPIELNAIRRHIEEAYEVEQIIGLGIECLNAVETYRIQEICKRLLNSKEENEIYRFYLEDKNKPLVKYLALGELGSSSLVFFRVRFQSPVILPMSKFEREEADFLGKSLDERANYIGIGKEASIKRILKHDEDSWATRDDLEPQQCREELFNVACTIVDH